VRSVGQAQEGEERKKVKDLRLLIKINADFLSEENYAF
jgi:hypothetical protein